MPFRPASRPNHSPVQSVPDLSGVKQPEHDADQPPHFSAGLLMGWIKRYIRLPSMPAQACYEVNFTKDTWGTAMDGGNSCDRFFRKPIAKDVKEQVTNIFQKLVTYVLQLGWYNATRMCLD